MNREFCFRHRGMLFIPAAIIMLVLAQPTMLSLIVGLSMAMFVGEGIRIWAVGFTGVTTRHDKVKAPELVTAGPYAYVRNPLYVGNFISWLGFAIAAAGGSPIWAKAVILGTMLCSYCLIYGIIIPHEEKFLKETFGEAYDEFCRNVPKLVPRFMPWKNQKGQWKARVILTAEIHTIIMLIIFSAFLIMKYVSPWSLF